MFHVLERKQMQLWKWIACILQKEEGDISGALKNIFVFFLCICFWHSSPSTMSLFRHTSFGHIYIIIFYNKFRTILFICMIMISVNFLINYLRRSYSLCDTTTDRDRGAPKPKSILNINNNNNNLVVIIK